MNSDELLPEMTRSTQGYVGLQPTKTLLHKTSEEEGKGLMNSVIDFFRYQLDPADSFYQYARMGCLYTS